MKDNSQTFDIIAKTFEGLESVLADEIAILGGGEIEILKRAVKFQGDLSLVYKANLWLRTALRVIIPFRKFKVKNADDLYNAVKSVYWQQYLTPEMTIAVDSSINSSPFNHANFVALRVKDAIVDRMRDDLGKRPSVDTESPDLLINVHIFRNDCTLSFDSSGQSLHKRGYRLAQTDAPLNEVLAAGLILKTGWRGETDFYDPMCGSGTFTTEAFGIAMNEPPGKDIKFGFMRWLNYDKDLWNNIIKSSKDERKNVSVNFHTSDILEKAIAVTKKNMTRREMREKVVIKQIDFFDTKPESAEGLVIINPPYGERIDTKDIKSLYKKIGDKLKYDYPGFNAWVLLASPEAEKSIGLKPSAKHKVLNGAIECKFNKYDLFKGSKKDQFPTAEIEVSEVGDDVEDIE